MAGCVDAACRVYRLNKVFNSRSRAALDASGFAQPWRHRVILYPSAFFTTAATRVVCYDSEALAARLAGFLGEHVPSCPLNPRDVPRINVAKAAAAEFGDAAQVDELLTSRNIYPEDVRLWRERCQ